VTRREAWRVEYPYPKSGGTLSTAGNLVFQGGADGKFRAYRATDGKVLWEFDGGVGIAAAPMTYTVEGNQYVAVLAGWGGPMVLGNTAAGRGKVGFGTLLSFSLGGTATLPRYTRPVAPVPMPDFQVKVSRRELEEGTALYATFCRRCHGGDVVSGGSVPDLRFAEISTHRTFEEIVRGGARRELGMPSFAEDITTAQARSIHAYVLERQRESARRDAERP
jgi:quinohemoprotein ethanol dehydrogenase